MDILKHDSVDLQRYILCLLIPPLVLFTRGWGTKSGMVMRGAVQMKHIFTEDQLKVLKLKTVSCFNSRGLLRDHTFTT